MKHMSTQVTTKKSQYVAANERRTARAHASNDTHCCNKGRATDYRKQRSHDAQTIPTQVYQLSVSCQCMPKLLKAVMKL